MKVLLQLKKDEYIAKYHPADNYVLIRTSDSLCRDRLYLVMGSSSIVQINEWPNVEEEI